MEIYKEQIISKDLKQLIKGTLIGFHPEIKDESLFVEDLKLDELDLIELLMSAETLFEIQIMDDEFEQCKNVNDLSKLIYKTLKKNERRKTNIRKTE